MKNEKMHRINLNVPEWAYQELEQVARDKEWTISHLVRSLVCRSVTAWLSKPAYDET